MPVSEPLISHNYIIVVIGSVKLIIVYCDMPRALLDQLVAFLFLLTY